MLLNGKEYNLCLLDTNIISVTLKKSQSIEKNVFRKLSENNIFVFSPVTLVEMYPRQSVLNLFCDFFSKIPIIILKSSKDIYELEKKYYPNKPKQEDIVDLIINPNFNNVHNEIQAFVKTSEFQATREDLLRTTDEIFENNQFKEESELIRKYNLTAEDYIKLIIQTRQKQEGKNYAVDLKDDSFLSLKVQYLLRYYNYMVRNLKVRKSDLNDSLIASSIPYINTFITENNQAKTLKLIKEEQPIISKLDILNMADLRE